MLGFVADLIRLCRLPHMGAIALIPVLGALSIGIFNLDHLIILYIVGMFLNIYLFVSNDVVDAELDKMSKLSRDFHARAIAKGTISKKTGILISAISLILSYLISFMFFYRNNICFLLGILILSIGVILCTIYNVWGKHFASSAFIAAFASGLGVFYGSYMTAENINLNILTIVVFFLVSGYMLFLTAVVGGFKDAGNDYKQGGRTIALLLGVKINEEKKTVHIPLKFKIFTLGVGSFLIISVFSPFLFFNINYKLWQLLMMFTISIMTLFFSFEFLGVTFYDTVPPQVK